MGLAGGAWGLLEGQQAARDAPGDWDTGRRDWTCLQWTAAGETLAGGCGGDVGPGANLYPVKKAQRTARARDARRTGNSAAEERGGRRWGGRAQLLCEDEGAGGYGCCALAAARGAGLDGRVRLLLEPRRGTARRQFNDSDTCRRIEQCDCGSKSFDRNTTSYSRPDRKPSLQKRSRLAGRAESSRLFCSWDARCKPCLLSP